MAAGIAKFFIDLSIDHSATLPLLDEGGEKVDFSSPKWGDNSRLLIEVTAAACYGSVLGSGTIRALTKQRILHLANVRIAAAYDNEREHMKSSEPGPPARVGLLLLACHVVCCSDTATMGPKSLHQLTVITVGGLESEIFAKGAEKATPQAKNLILAAVLKILTTAKSSVDRFLLTVITGFLRAYAVSDPYVEVSSKMLALQGLQAIAMIEGASEKLSPVKPAVVSVLSAATSHPSGVLRQIAVEARNAWFLRA